MTGGSSGVRKKDAVNPSYSRASIEPSVVKSPEFRHALRSYCAEQICTISVSSISARGKWAAWPDGSCPTT